MKFIWITTYVSFSLQIRMLYSDVDVKLFEIRMLFTL